MSVVTIRGRLGSGAPEIGRGVAHKLHVDYVDREIIAEVAARLHRQEPDVIAKEMPPASLRGRIAEALERGFTMGAGFEGSYLPVWEMPLDDTRYLEALRALIKELAAGRSIVIYGRGSQFILRDHPRALHVSVTAPVEVRLKRVMESLRLDEERARQEIARFDKSAREFIRRYFRAELEDPVHYDLVINTEHLTFEAATSIVVDALGFKEAEIG